MSVEEACSLPKNQFSFTFGWQLPIAVGIWFREAGQMKVMKKVAVTAALGGAFAVGAFPSVASASTSCSTVQTGQASYVDNAYGSTEYYSYYTTTCTTTNWASGTVSTTKSNWFTRDICYHY